MAAPTNTWEFAYDLFGTSVPIVSVFAASADLEVSEGTLVSLVDGMLEVGLANPIGLAYEATTAPLDEGVGVKVGIIAPGMVIRGKASADASELVGFNGKAYDVTAEGALDVADDSGGALSVHRVENAGMSVWCVLTKHALFG